MRNKVTERKSHQRHSTTDVNRSKKELSNLKFLEKKIRGYPTGRVGRKNRGLTEEVKDHCGPNTEPQEETRRGREKYHF